MDPRDEQRFALLPTTRYVSWVAVALGALGVLLWQPVWARLGMAAVTLLVLGMTLALRLRRPQLVLTADGYRVEVRGRPRFAVAWSEVRKVLVDRSEGALYVDCGDRARNLLLPPRRGYAFTFSRREDLFQAVLRAVPDRLEEVKTLEDRGQKTS